MGEIVGLIAGELVASKAKATAVVLAGCRKSFEDTVPDTLRGTQKLLLQLFKSLPGDVWNEGGCTVSAPTFWFESLSKDSRRRWNGLVSGGMLGGCERSSSLGL